MTVVRYEVERGIATITLDSPRNRNALSNALRTGLAEALASAAGDADVRGVVLTGAGPAFCAGADLKEAASGEPPTGPGIPELLGTLLDHPKPVIARLNGPARAGGLGLVAACDIAVAPDDVTFAFTEVRIGVAPAVIAVACRLRMTPRALSRYFLTGETFSAADAVASGLLTAAAPRDELDALVEGMADGLRKAEPKAVARTKRLVDELAALDRADAFALAERLSLEFFMSPEAAEGRLSFFEKRPPSWAR
ncbi:Carnitinyl-CoA dehydratase [Actinomadura rubteroloni]|uniref:Carnitinyl-CoA dehydratase n=1 Tax=Actinomadura rubteroloni TaxID=1926885 RepID=A0A2P4UNR8_9ACTN|nr:enoyl-CoA hydratase-related protein [Actinomadura rubteroloni]POM26698.1 Carnitinyl-CoA dehydratase [Actinomadura rubteroloni]